MMLLPAGVEAGVCDQEIQCQEAEGGVGGGPGKLAGQG